MTKRAAVWKTVLIISAVVVFGITLAFVIAGMVDWTLPATYSTIRNFTAAAYSLALVAVCGVLVLSSLRPDWRRYAWGCLLMALALAAKVFGPAYYPLSTEYYLWQSATSLLGAAGAGLVVWEWQKQRSSRSKSR